MFKFIAKVLIVFILFAGVTWAADMDEIGCAEESQSIAVAGDDNLSSDPASSKASVDVPCDHCCHGAAHFVGFPSQAGAGLVDGGTDFFVVLVVAHATRGAQVPFHPPKI